MDERSFAAAAAALSACIIAGVFGSHLRFAPSTPSPTPSASMSVAQPIAHVWISAAGTVYLDKQQTTIAELDAALTRLADANGVVWYSRENADADPGAAQDKSMRAVLDVIIAHRLPVRLLPSDPDGEPPTKAP